MTDKEKVLWQLDILRDYCKKRVLLANQTDWLGICEVLHDCIHNLDGNCGQSHCDGVDAEVLAKFINAAT